MAQEIAAGQYSAHTESYMRLFYLSLNEKDRRHYAAVEAQRLGHGGIDYIATVLDCSRQTIYSGLDELKKKSPNE